MTIYTATFRTSGTWATEEIDAATPEQALQQARALAENDTNALDWCSYDPGFFPLEEIEITGPDDASTVWQSEDLALRLAANDLLEALRYCEMTLADFEASERKGYIAHARTLARPAIVKATTT